MKKFLLLVLLFISSIGVSQDFPDGMVVVEFNASFNKSNEVRVLVEMMEICTGIPKSSIISEYVDEFS